MPQFKYFCANFCHAPQNPTDLLFARDELRDDDQMRWDYLYRYYERYGEGGFKRLLSHGFSCDNTMINYLPSFVGVSLKDRAAILPAGHAATAAFWLDDSTGHFIPSNYYMTKLPAWVDSFNGKEPIKQYMKNKWNTLYSRNTYEGWGIHHGSQKKLSI
jgi:hypothetical protein